MDKLGWIKNFMEECKQCWSPVSRSRVPRSIDLLVNWQKPPVNWLKINVDGARNQFSEVIGAGGLIRDHKGKWQIGFVHDIGFGHSLLAEAWAMLNGAQIALDRGYTKVIIESDSMELVTLLNVTDPYPLGQFLNSIIQDIKSRLNKIPQVKVTHCFRESNSCADNLAKLAFSTPNGLTVLHDPPQDMQSLLLNDYHGTPKSRMCPGLDVG